MNRKIKTGSGILTLGSSDFLASGGEADVFRKSNKVYKIYHDSNKMLPEAKIKELSAIKNNNVIIPKEIIYDVSSGKSIGYTTDYVDNSSPLLKLFTKTFKNDNNIDGSMINELVKYIQLITIDIHNSKCLIVDFNELNVLVNIGSSILTPYFIDVDSYCTSSFKASAIMESIRDRLATVFDKDGKMHYNPTVLSDWFSFGILAFQLYSNIHPYRGSHSSYKPKDKAKQMDDGISVFHPGVRVPPSVNNFNTCIPPRHLSWFKDEFEKNNRSIPPLPDSIVPFAVPNQIIIIKGTDKLDIKEIDTYPDNILYTIQNMGVNYVVTKSHIYANNKEIIEYKNINKALVCSSPDGTMISAYLKGTIVSFAEMSTGIPFSTIQSNDVFQRNGAFYTIAAGKLVENSFSLIGSKLIHRTVELENISQYSTHFYDGCLFQNLLGKWHLVLPYKKGASFSKYIKELDGFRIVAAKCDKNVVIVLSEKSGCYYRFIIVFEKNYQSFEIREEKDVSYDNINMAVLDNGLCILLSSPTEIQLFFKSNQFETLSNPPFDSSMNLFSRSDGFYFINNNSIFHLKKK